MNICSFNYQRWLRQWLYASGGGEGAIPLPKMPSGIIPGLNFSGFR